MAFAAGYATSISKGTVCFNQKIRMDSCQSLKTVNILGEISQKPPLLCQELDKVMPQGRLFSIVLFMILKARA